MNRADKFVHIKMRQTVVAKERKDIHWMANRLGQVDCKFYP